MRPRRPFLRRSIFLSCVGAEGTVRSDRSGGGDHCPLFSGAASFLGRTAAVQARPGGAAPVVARRKTDAEEMAVRCLLLDLQLESEARRKGSLSTPPCIGSSAAAPR